MARRAAKWHPVGLCARRAKSRRARRGRSRRLALRCAACAGRRRGRQCVSLPFSRFEGRPADRRPWRRAVRANCTPQGPGPGRADGPNAVRAPPNERAAAEQKQSQRKGKFAKSNRFRCFLIFAAIHLLILSTRPNILSFYQPQRCSQERKTEIKSSPRRVEALEAHFEAPTGGRPKTGCQFL